MMLNVRLDLAPTFFKRAVSVGLRVLKLPVTYAKLNNGGFRWIWLIRAPTTKRGLRSNAGRGLIRST